GAVVSQRVRSVVNVGFFDATGFFNLFGRPFGQDFVANGFHAIDAVMDVAFVFPAIFEDVIRDAEQYRDVGTGAEADVVIGFGGSTRKARIRHNDLTAFFTGVQQ